MATLQDMITQVRLRTDTVGSQHITETELISYLNYGCSEVYGMIINSFEGYFVNTIQFTLTPSDDGYTLPTDFFKEFRFDKSYTGVASSLDWQRLPLVNPKDEASYNANPTRAYWLPTVRGYMMYGNRIKPVPTCDIAGVYRLLYFPTFTELVNLADVVQLGPTSMHWEEYGILHACICVALKEESEPTGFILQKTKLEKRIQDEAANRNSEADPPPTAGGWNRFMMYNNNGGVW